MLNNNHKYYIVCHDPELISNHYQKQFTYLFVGNKYIDKFKHRNKNIIVCRDLPNNLEQYPYLCSFTAWYAISRNNRHILSNYSFLEYDTQILSNNFFTNTITANQIICYDITLFDHYVFSKSTPWLEISLKKIYNIELKDLVAKYKNRYKYWPTSTNITLSQNTLDQFVDWFLPMTKLFQNHKLGSYVHERAFFIFCILHNIEIIYQKNTLKHYQLESHKSIDIYGQFLKNKDTTIFTQQMKPEYDKVYEKELRIALSESEKL